MKAETMKKPCVKFEDAGLILCVKIESEKWLTKTLTKNAPLARRPPDTRPGKVSKGAKIRNRNNQVPNLTQDTSTNLITGFFL